MQVYACCSFLAVLAVAGGLQPPPGCGPLPASGPGAPDPAPAPRTATLTAAEVDDCAQVPPAQEEFGVLDTRDVLVYAQYAALEDGVYVQRAAFYTPQGALYEELARAFAVGPGAPATVDAGGLGPLPVVAACGAADAPFIATTLNVSGTPIMMNVVAGTWRVVVTLDGQSAPVGELHFELAL